MSKFEPEVWFGRSYLEPAVKKLIEEGDDFNGDESFSTRYSPDVVLKALADFLTDQVQDMLDYPRDYISGKSDFENALDRFADKEAQEWCKQAGAVITRIPSPWGKKPQYLDWYRITFKPGTYSFRVRGLFHLITLIVEVNAESHDLHDAFVAIKEAAIVHAAEVKTYPDEPRPAEQQQDQQQDQQPAEIAI
jgi:hypothetical protein